MSSLKVPVYKIKKAEPHPNADRLDLVYVEGWVCVTGRGNFKEGDLCVYFPVDSVLPEALEASLFPPDSKIKLSHHRIKTIKIRQQVSQGMCVPVADIATYLGGVEGGALKSRRTWVEDEDVAALLGVTKYEPPKKELPPHMRGKKKSPKNNPHFHKYTDLENIKWYTTVFQPGEPVSISEKIHGTNFRCGWVPFVPSSWWEKLKSWMGFAPEWQFVYGSRNLQLNHAWNEGKPNFYEKKGVAPNVYLEAVQKYDLPTKIPKGVVVFGEIYGSGIQPGYSYGCGDGERKLVLFDAQEVTPDGVRYMDVDEFDNYLINSDLFELRAPILYEGEYSAAAVEKYTKGDSVLAPVQKVREGVVVRPAKERVDRCGRAILKSINPDYLLGTHADQEVAHDQVS